NLSFTNILSAPASVVDTAAITIPNFGLGVPYPSATNVTGLTGLVAKARVTLHGFSHSFPSDVNVLLVGPGGPGVLLMSHTGGGAGVNNLDLTFDDGAL